MRHPTVGRGAALQPFCVSDPIICRRVEITRTCSFDIPATDIKSTRVPVVGSGRCFYHYQPGVLSLKPSLNLIQEDGSASGPLRGRIDGDPIQIVRAIGAGRWSVAGKAGQLLFRGEGAEEGIIGDGWRICTVAGVCSICATRRRKNGIEKFECNVDLFAPENTSRFENRADSRTILWRHFADKNSHQLVPDRRSAAFQSSGDVSIWCLNPASQTRWISAV